MCLRALNRAVQYWCVCCLCAGLAFWADASRIQSRFFGAFFNERRLVPFRSWFLLRGHHQHRTEVRFIILVQFLRVLLTLCFFTVFLEARSKINCETLLPGLIFAYSACARCICFVLLSYFQNFLISLDRHSPALNSEFRDVKIWFKCTTLKIYALDAGVDASQKLVLIFSAPPNDHWSLTRCCDSPSNICPQSLSFWIEPSWEGCLVPNKVLE